MKTVRAPNVAPAMTDTDYDVLMEIQNEPGITAKGVALRLEVTDAVYGIYQAVSRSIAKLRAQGLVQDVKIRCGACGAAHTRGHRNVPLHVTALGATL